MNKKIKHFFIDFLFLLVIFIFIYWRVSFIFFQQDEWLSFGLMSAQEQGLPINLGIDFHFVPLNLFIANLLFKLFGLNYIAYNLVGLIFHFINGVLVYLISFKLLQKRIISLISSILFITSPVASQLVMWPAVSIATLSLTFTLTAWIILLKNSINRRIIWSFLIAILMILAFLTMEYSLGLLLFIPVAFLFLHRKIDRKEKIVFILPIFIMNFIYFVTRFIILSLTTSNSSVKLSEGYFLDFIGKFFYIPFKSLTQLTIPENILIFISHLFTKNIIKAETIIFQYLTIGIGIIISLIIVYFLFVIVKRGKLIYKNSLIMILVFLFSCVLPFLLLPGIAGNFIIFPPRYLYFGISGVALLVGIMFDASWLNKNLKSHFNVLIKFLLIFSILFMIIVGTFNNLEKEKVLVSTGKEREDILNIIKKSYPKLPEKVIFFIESDSSYYYQEEKILPFQSGLGQILLVWYRQENLGIVFYTNRFLWEINSQGYQEIGNRGFGYFRDYQLLRETVKKYQIPVESVIGFSWKGKDESFVNISDKIREHLKVEIYE